MGKIARYLNELIVGNVFDSPDILDAYAVDQSIVKIRPKAVAFPESTEDISKLMYFCNQMAIKDIKVPVAIRGSGLDEMGADLGEGIVVSTEKLDHLLEADRRERLVRVQSGITLKELNTALSMYGLTIPIGGRDSETIGGLISNCPSDAYSGKYGGIMNYVERIEVVLPNGEILQTCRQGAKTIAKIMEGKTAESKLYRKINDLIKNNAGLIQDIKQGTHGSAGYPTIAQVERKGTLDLMPLFFGAQGTLGIISEVILLAVPMHNKKARVVATFKDYVGAQKFLEFMNELGPCQLDLYDINIIRSAKNLGKKLDVVSDRVEFSFVVFGKFDHRVNTCLKKVESIRNVLPRTAHLVVECPEDKPKLDEFENSLESYLNQVRKGERVPLAVDFYLPSENIMKFLDDLVVVEKTLNLELKFFGSYAASNYNLRPKFNLEDEDFAKKTLAFIRACNFIIERQGGSITGGSPEGRVKAIVTNPSMPGKETGLYQDIKKAFDPCGILNSDIKLNADSKYTIKHLRTTNSVKTVL